MLPSPAIVSEVYGMHKKTWTAEEKRLVHEKLNQHKMGDGTDLGDQAVTEVMMMIYVDGIRKGRGEQ